MKQGKIFVCKGSGRGYAWADTDTSAQKALGVMPQNKVNEWLDSAPKQFWWRQNK